MVRSPGSSFPVDSPVPSEIAAPHPTWGRGKLGSWGSSRGRATNSSGSLWLPSGMTVDGLATPARGTPLGSPGPSPAGDG